MDFIRTVIDRVLHLNVYLPVWADDMGPWLYVILFAVIFCETGLVVTPFLPGDSLLFAVGAVIALPGSTLNLPLMLGLLIVAAVLGDAVNYYIGYRVGPAVFRSEKSWLFNRKHLLRTQQFYEKYGSVTIIIARFVPIVRTFAPFVAGIGKMQYRKFFAYNVGGGVGWVLIFVLLGYFFGTLPVVQQNFKYIMIAIIVISVMPMVVEYVLARRRAAKGEPGPAQVGLNGSMSAERATAPQAEPTSPR
jgi:membrane-associated protein